MSCPKFRKVPLSCDLYPVRYLTSTSSTSGLDAVLQPRAKHYVMKRITVIGLKNLLKHFMLELMQGMRGLARVSCSAINFRVGNSGIVGGFNSNDAPKESYVVSVNFLDVFFL